MSKYLIYGGRKYRPLLTSDNMMDVRAMTAYGNAKSGQFMLSVYVLCVPFGAGSRGGSVADRHVDICAYREMVPNTTPESEQFERLTFMLNIVATRIERDYKLRLPISTKAPPKLTRRT